MTDDSRLTDFLDAERADREDGAVAKDDGPAAKDGGASVKGDEAVSKADGAAVDRDAGDAAESEAPTGDGDAVPTMTYGVGRERTCAACGDTVDRWWGHDGAVACCKCKEW